MKEPGMEGNHAANEGPCDELDFERSLAELETIVHDLEDGQLGLADALERYEQGIKHLKHCYKVLEAAERKIELLTGVTDDGAAIAEPFDESSESLASSAGRRKRGKASSRASDDINKDDIGA
jgi:exodeoxyribonuclease VII small subunit